MFEPQERKASNRPVGGAVGPMEVLQRLRDSYRGVPERGTLSAVDQTVLAAVEITLDRLARAS